MLAAIFAITVAALPASAQQGVGAKYGARDPHACPKVQATSDRPPSAAVAAAAFACQHESESAGDLSLVGNVRVQVGGGTPYNDLPSISRPGGAARNATIYAIRGSYSSYICGNIRDYPAGQNCRRFDYPRAQGTCFSDQFGEWVCSLRGDASPPYGTDKQPPPKD